MQKPYELDWSRLPLEGAFNVRELGGYPVSNGVQTRYHRFLRADSLSDLTEADRAFLSGYGVRLVLDLRDYDEVAANPDVSISDDVEIVNVPLLVFDISDKEELARRFSENPPTYEYFYDLILANKESVARCFRLIADAPEGSCVLFHCAVGKDRTGVLAFLLMALAGCDKWDCVANYVQTRANLMRHPWFETYWNDGDPNAVLNDSPAFIMEHCWGVVQEAGGIETYLLGCGVSADDIASVKSRLLA